jgi:hypothetical protein
VYNEDISGSDIHIENLIGLQKDRIEDLLTAHKDILLECSKILVAKKEISAADFISQFGERLGITGTIVSTNHDVFGDYHNILMQQ